MSDDDTKPDEPNTDRTANPTTHPEPTHPVPPPPSRGPGRVLLDTAATADYLGYAEQTLVNWRSLGEGPPYVKAGGRVRYDVRKLDRWLDKHTVGAA